MQKTRIYDLTLVWHFALISHRLGMDCTQATQNDVPRRSHCWRSNINGVGIKKRHAFPIAIGLLKFSFFAMAMVWKKLTWFLLIVTNIDLLAQFVFLRRKALLLVGMNTSRMLDLRFLNIPSI